MKPKKEQFDERKLKHSEPLNEDEKSWEDQDACPRCNDGLIGEGDNAITCRHCHGLGVVNIRSKR